MTLWSGKAGAGDRRRQPSRWIQSLANPARRNAARLGLSLFTSALLVAALGEVHAAGDLKAGRGKSLLCQACHGTDGMSLVPEAPNIAGQTEPYLVMQLQAFKSGGRKSDTMSLVAQTLSDKDIEDLAAYFSAIEIRVVRTPAD